MTTLNGSFVRTRITIVPCRTAHPHKDPMRYALHTAAASFKPCTLDRTAWLIDSGASDHIACDLRYFIDWKRLQKPIPITLGNQSSIQATCIGTIMLKLSTGHTLKLQDALYAPDIGCNLLSVGKLTSGSCKMTFQSGICQVLDKTGACMSSCKRVNGMYKLHCQVMDKTVLALQAAKSAISAAAAPTAAPTAATLVPPASPLPLQVWHRRLGHLNGQSVKLLASGLATEIAISRTPGGKPTCPPCLVGKQKEQIRRTPQNRASRPLELIHSDMGGPLPISLGGNRFFIIFVDDFSRMTWIFFMPTKSANDPFTAWTEFKRASAASTSAVSTSAASTSAASTSAASTMNASMSYRIARLRSDGGSEFNNADMQDDLRHLGIIWEPSAPYTQHQNGVSERTIQTLQNIARSMLFDAQVEVELWPEAMKTAAYLRNRFPTSALDKMTPYEAWFGRKPSLAHLDHLGVQPMHMYHPN